MTLYFGDGTNIATATGLGAKVVRIESTVKKNTFSDGLGQGAESANAITCSITPSSSSNLILVLASINMSCSNDNRNHIILGRDGSVISNARGDANSSNQRVTCASFNQATSYQSNINVNYLDTAGTTSSITYHIRLSHGRNSSATVYLNRAASEGSGSDRSRAASYLTLIELTPN